MADKIYKAAIKEIAGELQAIIEDMRLQKNLDQRWIDMAEMRLQEGLTALTCAVTKSVVTLWRPTP